MGTPLPSKRTSYCLCLDIAGTLKRSTNEELASLFPTPDGGHASAEEAKKILHQELNKGHKVLPFGQPCEGFSYIDGCKGHPVT